MTDIDFIDGQVTLPVENARLGWYAVAANGPDEGFGNYRRFTVTTFYSNPLLSKALGLATQLEGTKGEIREAIGGLEIDRINEIFNLLNLREIFEEYIKTGIDGIGNYSMHAEGNVLLMRLPDIEEAVISASVRAFLHRDNKEAVIRLGKHLFYSAAKTPELQDLVGSLEDLQKWELSFDPPVSGTTRSPNRPGKLTLPGEPGFTPPPGLNPDL